MELLQFSTSHYCRKARLALGFKGVPYRITNLEPGLHRLRVEPLTGTQTVPVLLTDTGRAIGDSTAILHYLETYYPEPAWQTGDPHLWQIEDWADESLGTASRFLYYEYRFEHPGGPGSSWLSPVLVRLVRRRFGINRATAALATERLHRAMEFLLPSIARTGYISTRLSPADIAVAGLLSPLALTALWPDQYPELFNWIAKIHQECHEETPPGLTLKTS